MSRKKILAAIFAFALAIGLVVFWGASEDPDSETVHLQTEQTLQTPKTETKSQRFKVRGGFQLQKK